MKRDRKEEREEKKEKRGEWRERERRESVERIRQKPKKSNAPGVACVTSPCHAVGRSRLRFGCALQARVISVASTNTCRENRGVPWFVGGTPKPSSQAPCQRPRLRPQCGPRCVPMQANKLTVFTALVVSYRPPSFHLVLGLGGRHQNQTRSPSPLRISCWKNVHNQCCSC